MAHTYTNLLIHALFSTKDREPMIRPEMKSDLYAYMGGIISNLKGKPLLINGPRDHVHLLFVLPASLSLADFMEKVKANSSRWAKERVRGFSWQTGSAAFSVSSSKLEEVKAYIAQQEEHHRRLHPTAVAMGQNLSALRASGRDTQMSSESGGLRLAFTRLSL